VFQHRLSVRVELDIGGAQWVQRATAIGGEPPARAECWDDGQLLDGATDDEPLPPRLVRVGVRPLVIGSAQQDAVACAVRVWPSDATGASVVPVGAWEAATGAQPPLSAHDDGPLGGRQALGFHILTIVETAAARG
jgi:hypothetical protein